jgi:hypothetical protein
MAWEFFTGDDLVVVAAIIASLEPVMPTRRDVLLTEATGVPAKPCLLVTMQMFEV